MFNLAIYLNRMRILQRRTSAHIEDNYFQYLANILVLDHVSLFDIVEDWLNA